MVYTLISGGGVISAVSKLFVCCVNAVNLFARLFLRKYLYLTNSLGVNC